MKKIIITREQLEKALKVELKNLDWKLYPMNCVPETITLEIPDEQVEEEKPNCPFCSRPNSQCHYWDGKKKPLAPELPEELEEIDSTKIVRYIPHKVIMNREAINQLIRYLKARE